MSMTDCSETLLCPWRPRRLWCQRRSWWLWCMRWSWYCDVRDVNVSFEETVSRDFSSSDFFSYRAIFWSLINQLNNFKYGFKFANIFAIFSNPSAASYSDEPWLPAISYCRESCLSAVLYVQCNSWLRAAWYSEESNRTAILYSGKSNPWLMIEIFPLYEKAGSRTAPIYISESDRTLVEYNKSNLNNIKSSLSLLKEYANKNWLVSGFTTQSLWNPCLKTPLA